MSSSEPFDLLKEKVWEVITKIFPLIDVDITEIKEEVWTDLSKIYYKYEDENQKRAFREVIKEISEKIQKDKWDTVYKKIYRQEQKEKSI